MLCALTIINLSRPDDSSKDCELWYHKTHLQLSQMKVKE